MTTAPVSAPSLARWPALCAVGFLAVVVVGLHVVVDPAAYDVSQLPRLLVLSLVLLVTVPLLALPPVARRLDPSVLGEPVVVASAAFTAVSALSLGVALNRSAGWTDVFRTFDALVVLAVACLLLPLDRDWRRRVVQAMVLAAATSAVIGVVETVSLLGPGLHSRRAMEVVTGRMSNVNLYAGVLAILLPWCMGGMAGVAGFRGLWRWLAAATAMAASLMLVLVQSRGAWLAMAAAGAVVAGVALVASERIGLSTRVRRLVAAMLVAATALAASVGVVATTDTPLGEWVRTTFVSRPHQRGGPTDGGRTVIWRVATEMFADHPFTGVGAGNFTVRLHEYIRDEFDFSALPSDNWIQPHNDFLWVAAEKGVPGLVAFVSIFMAAFLAIRGVIVAGTMQEARLAVVCLGSLVAYSVFSCVDFPLDRVTHQVLLAIVLAVVTLGRHGVRGGGASVPWAGWFVVPPVAAGLVFAALYSAAALEQEREVIVARRACRDGDWPAMLEAARRAATPWKSLDPLATPIAFLEGMARHRLGDPAALRCLEEAVIANPNRMYVVNNLGGLYAEAGRFDEAITCFAVAADRYPDRIEPRHNLAACLVERERYAEAVAILDEIPEPLRPPAVVELLTVARERLANESRTASPE
jgi:O-antigen ligase